MKNVKTKATDTLDSILESLAHIVCSDPELNGSAPVHLLNAMDFDGYEPLCGFDDDWILLGDTVSDQPIWPIDVCTAFKCDGEETGWPEGTWQFHRVKTLKMKEWRGKITKFTPCMIDALTLVSRPDGTRVSARVPYGLIGDKLFELPRVNAGLRLSGLRGYDIDPKWFGNAHHSCVEDDLSIIGTVRMAAGLALRKRYMWGVLLGEGTGPRARFLTDAVGMRESFRLRDIPPGRQRRAALLHWVREHWRKSRAASANDYAWVRAHLRGQWAFNWNGLRCQIEPSQEDAEKAIGVSIPPPHLKTSVSLLPLETPAAC